MLQYNIYIYIYIYAVNNLIFVRNNKHTQTNFNSEAWKVMRSLAEYSNLVIAKRTRVPAW